MTQYKPSSWIPFVFVIILLVSACAPAIPAVIEPAVDQATVPQNTPTQATEAVETEESDQPAAPSLVPVKSALEATDPGSVTLASGSPLLVEFFAFW